MNSLAERSVGFGRVRILAATIVAVFVPQYGALHAGDARGGGATAISGVTIAEVSSEYRNSKEGPYMAEKLVGGRKSGLHYKGKPNTHSTVSDNFYKTGRKGTMWMATTKDDKNYIIFDLGEIHRRLAYIKIWNWNNPKTIKRGAKEIEIYVSAEKLPFGDGKWKLGARSTLSKGPGKHDIPFGDKIKIHKKNVRYVLLRVKSTYGMKPAGLSEVAFFGNAAE